MLIHTTHEHGPTLLGKDWDVLQGQGEAPIRRVIFQITGTRQCTQPLTRVALVDLRDSRKLSARRWSMRNECFEQAESVAKGTHGAYYCTAQITHDLVHE